jgi:hypothetical protein
MRGYQYVEADKGLAPIRYYPDLLSAAQGMGYTSVREAIVQGYGKLSLRKLGHKLGRSKMGLVPLMDKIGIKRRSRGGCNRYDGHRYDGKICKRHGTTERYTVSRMCVICVAEANQRAREKKARL